MFAVLGFKLLVVSRFSKSNVETFCSSTYVSPKFGIILKLSLSEYVQILSEMNLSKLSMKDMNIKIDNYTFKNTKKFYQKNKKVKKVIKFGLKYFCISFFTKATMNSKLIIFLGDSTLRQHKSYIHSLSKSNVETSSIETLNSSERK